MGPADLFLPAESLTAPYMLVQTLAALYANASIAINSVAGIDVPLTAVVRGVSPTIIAATSLQAYSLHDETRSSITSAAQKFALSTQTASLKSGSMPTTSLATRISTPATAVLGQTPGALRLLYIFDRSNSDTPPASSARLSDLRAFTGARVIHALTTAKVAGSVAQTGLYDYRREDDDTTAAHFGVPPSCLELFVKDKGDYRTTDATVQGEVS